jgi:LemA protein
MSNPCNKNTGNDILRALLWAIPFSALLVWWLTFSARNALVEHRNNVDAAFVSINNTVQKRADLISTLSASAQLLSQHEKDVLLGVAQARASAKIALPENATQEQLEKFAQSQPSGTLGSLTVFAEKYPQLKSADLLLDFQDKISGVEKEILAARATYIVAIRKYNVSVESCPRSCIAASLFGFQKKPQLEFGSVEDAQKMRNEPPKVQFVK